MIIIQYDNRLILQENVFPAVSAIAPLCRYQLGRNSLHGTYIATGSYTRAMYIYVHVCTCHIYREWNHARARL